MQTTKRIKHVVNNPYHLWAHQVYAGLKDKTGADANFAHNSSRNRSFTGTRAYSYRACIGCIVPDKKGRSVFLMTSQKWSSLTSGHCGEAWAAIPYSEKEQGNVFSVPFMDVSDGVGFGYWGTGTSYPQDFHKGNVEHYVARFWSELETAKRARGYPAAYLQSAFRALERARTYAKRFGVKGVKYPSAKEVEAAKALNEGFAAKQAAFEAQREIRRETERKQARLRYEAWLAAAPERAAAEAERQRIWALEEEKRKAEAIEKRDAWLGGDTAIPTYLMRSLPYPMLRVRGNIVETTQGADAPLDHVKRAMPRVLQIVQSGQEFRPNGETFRLGHYTLSSIDAEGTVTIGCHRFPRAEVERFAKVLLELPESIA